jgi:hypothetical protein
MCAHATVDGYMDDVDPYPHLDQRAVVDLVLQAEKKNATLTYIQCTFEHDDGRELLHVAVCESSDMPDSCVMAVSYERTECSSVTPCSNEPDLGGCFTDLLYTADCSGISATMPDCKVECGQDNGSCFPTKKDESETHTTDETSSTTLRSGGYNHVICSTTAAALVVNGLLRIIVAG